ncbi:MAG: hypothetical protein ABNH03_12140 [Alteromonas sp.]|jgi:hypothetical protein|uniref:hypothetical protein n=1 Tax=unclassified Alteromonas TaxID=2614992 RepID=UPI0005098B5E|nr:MULTISPECIES: hypothetical protein [unclassified Alteromonas]
MSNDLLFPILPRNTKIVIEEDKRVKKVEKSKKSEHLSEEDSDQFDEVNRADALEYATKHRHETNKKDGDVNNEGGLKHIDVDV